MENYKNLEDKLDQIVLTVKHLLAIELYRNDVSQTDIAKHLHIAKSTVNKMLRGLKRNKNYECKKA